MERKYKEEIFEFYNKVTLHDNGFQALEWRHDARLRRDHYDHDDAKFVYRNEHYFIKGTT